MIVDPSPNPLPLNASVTRNFPRATLLDLSGGPRFERLDQYHAYFECTQDDAKAYDWDGYFRGYGIPAAIQPGWYVPLSLRKPSTTDPLAKVIVRRLTAMLFGDQNRPDLKIEGDEDAEHYARALAKEARLWSKIIEARNLGGATGAVALSYALIEGRPRIEVHNSKHTRVLRWRDRAEYVPEAVLKAYRFADEVYDPETQRFVQRWFWYARYWDATTEAVWLAVPDKVAKERRDWWQVIPADRVTEHGLEECPVVWVQNVHRSDDPDGYSDYDGQLDNLDSLNRLCSSSTKGTIGNTDPTLVVKTTKQAQPVKKGSRNAIYSEGGAEYLTLPGDGMKAAHEKEERLRASILDACGVVIPPAEKLSGAAQSAAAIRLLFAPMTATCDVLREQYGEMGIARVLAGMLRMCKAAIARGETVDLPPRFESERVDEEGESREVEQVEVEQSPGEREVITLSWPTYFPPTWTEKGEAVRAVKEATGGKVVLSHRTGVQATAQLFGVEDPDAELAAIDEDGERALEKQATEMERLAGFGPGGPDDDEPPGGPGTPPKPPDPKA